MDGEIAVEIKSMAEGWQWPVAMADGGGEKSNKLPEYIRGTGELAAACKANGLSSFVWLLLAVAGFLARPNSKITGRSEGIANGQGSFFLEMRRGGFDEGDEG